MVVGCGTDTFVFGSTRDTTTTVVGLGFGMRVGQVDENRGAAMMRTVVVPPTHPLTADSTLQEQGDRRVGGDVGWGRVGWGREVVVPPPTYSSAVALCRVFLTPPPAPTPQSVILRTHVRYVVVPAHPTLSSTNVCWLSSANPPPKQQNQHRWHPAPTVSTSVGGSMGVG